MNDILRFITTIAIWGIVGLVLLAAAMGPVNDLVPMTFMLAIGATGSTAVIWNAPRGDSAQTGNAAQRASKQKRNDRLTRMVDKLDDEDMAELEDLLIARHAETQNRLRDYE